MMKKILLSSLLVLMLIGSVQALEYGGIGGRPGNPDGDDSRTKSWFIYTLNPGETLQDTLTVQNFSDEPVDLILYPADSTPSTDGGFALEQQVEPRDFVGKWITLSESQIRLEPRASKEVPFTISVPRDDQLDVGEHTGGILIQRAEPAQENTGGLQLQTRVGVRVYVTIPGERIEKIEIEMPRVTLRGKTYVVATPVKNAGNVSQDVVVRTKISSLWPLQFLPSYKNLPLENQRDLQVLRGDTLISNFEFTKPLFGKLKIETAVDYQNGEKTLTNGPVEWLVPPDKNLVLFIVLGVIFIVAVIGLLVLRKRDEKKTQTKRKKK